jgi:hypothetical protein
LPLQGAEQNAPRVAYRRDLGVPELSDEELYEMALSEPPGLTEWFGWSGEDSQ